MWSWWKLLFPNHDLFHHDLFHHDLLIFALFKNCLVCTVAKTKKMPAPFLKKVMKSAQLGCLYLPKQLCPQAWVDEDFILSNDLVTFQGLSATQVFFSRPILSGFPLTFMSPPLPLARPGSVSAPSPLTCPPSPLPTSTSSPPTLCSWTTTQCTGLIFIPDPGGLLTPSWLYLQSQACQKSWSPKSPSHHHQQHGKVTTCTKNHSHDVEWSRMVSGVAPLWSARCWSRCQYGQAEKWHVQVPGLRVMSEPLCLVYALHLFNTGELTTEEYHRIIQSCLKLQVSLGLRRRREASSLSSHLQLFPDISAIPPPPPQIPPPPPPPPPITGFAKNKNWLVLNMT